MRDTLFAFVTFTRILLVVKALKLTVRFTRLLPVTLPSVTHCVPSQPCTLKAVLREGHRVGRRAGSLPVVLEGIDDHVVEGLGPGKIHPQTPR